jgi:cation diffusion facilitator CzcD-associated flavoprotein CzcO
MIIGAGPYGISLAYELWERNIPFVIAGKPFELWFKHTLDSSHIRSDRHTSEIYTRNNVFNLTKFIKDYDPINGKKLMKKRLSRLLFRDYLRDVLKKLPFNIEEQNVSDLSMKDNQYVSQLKDGQVIYSDSVVIATGVSHHQSMPENLANLDHPSVLHSWNVKDYQEWKNKKVLVVGGGQSAADCIQHLCENNEVSWVMRRSPIFYSEPINLPKPIFNGILYLSPYFYFLPESLKKKLGHKFVETTITPDMKKVFNHRNVQLVYADVNDLGIENEAGQLYSSKLEQTFDGIVAATGFHYDVNNLPFLSDELAQSLDINNGVPHIDFNFETNIKNFHIVGGIVEQAYGPAQRFMMGSRHVTLRLGKVL